MGGAGGSLRAGVTDNPVRLTRSVKDALTRVTSGGAPVYVWPGGGITFMVDVTQMPAGAFGYVPTPALVAPIEFTLRLSDYAALGGHMDHVRPLASLRDNTEIRPMPYIPGTARMKRLPQIALLPDGKRLHLQDGPIDLIIEAKGSEADVRAAYEAAARRFTGLLDELCDELAELRKAADPARCALKGVGRAPHACGGRAVCRRLLHHADGGGGGRVAEEILGAMLAAARLDRAYVNNGGDIALHLDRRRAVHRRPDGPAGPPRPDADDDHRRRRSRRAASRPAAATAAVFRSALPMPSPCWRERRRRPMPPPPSSPMPSICPAIPPSSAVRRMNCSPTAISARAWSPATSVRCRESEIDDALRGRGAPVRGNCSRRD